MLNNIVTLTYSPIATGTPVDVEYQKRWLGPRSSEFQSTTSLNEPSLSFDRFTVKTVEAKPTPTFYGVRRAYFNFRRDYLEDSPIGEKLQPAVLKAESSLPATMSSDDATDFIQMFRAYVNSQSFMDQTMKLFT